MIEYLGNANLKIIKDHAGSVAALTTAVARYRPANTYSDLFTSKGLKRCDERMLDDQRLFMGARNGIVDLGERKANHRSR